MNRVSMVAVGAVALSVFAIGRAGATTPKVLVVPTASGPVNASNSQYVDTAPAGPSVGDFRTYYLPITRPGHTEPIGYATGSLTTVAVGQPSAGMELRTANLVFVIGQISNQIVVGGIAAYPESAPTVASKTSVTRPIIGGSGKYAGARGWCVTTHYANDTWTHVFHIIQR